MGDGNFHMQLRSQAKPLSEDPSYYCDAGFFAEQKLYRNYTACADKMRGNESKVRVLLHRAHNDSGSNLFQNAQCASQAGTPSRDRPSSNLAVSGIYALSCKHGWFKKNGVVDIPKGERYLFKSLVVAGIN
jgi:hypothetical protein